MIRATLVVFAVAGAALVAATHASARQAACRPSADPSIRRFCGPATATLKVGGKTYLFKQGICAIDGATWTLNIGTITLKGTPKHRYFGITVFSRKAGTHGAAISWQLPGKATQSLNHAKVTLARGLKKGTFKGTTFGGGRTARGSFSCK